MGTIKVTVLIQCILALVLAILGVKLLLPDRNVWGNPQFETLMMQCQIPSTEAIIRLYQGNGGATVAYWYSVTFDYGKFLGEKQIFYAYAYPSIQSIDCRADEVTVLADEQSWTFSLKEIKNQLINQPIGFYKGETQQKSIQPLRILTLSFGVLLELISVWILSRSFKQFRASRHPTHPRNSRT